jgi:hypothetical protein
VFSYTFYLILKRRSALLKKPVKKTDKELMKLICHCIEKGNYIFVRHAKQRLADRAILDTDVLNILENKKGCKRKRNKIKDKYCQGFQDWNYCFEGLNLDSAVDPHFLTQHLDLSSYLKNCFITNKVTAKFFNTLSKSICCTR